MMENTPLPNIQDGATSPKKHPITGQDVIILARPTTCPISSTFLERGRLWTWHWSQTDKKWINEKDGEGFGYHKGLDFKCPVGTAIRAVAPGKILKIGWESDRKPPVDTGFGLRIIQTFKFAGKNYLAYYGHLSEILVREGQEVQPGEVVGESGNTGKSSGPHLHLEVRDAVVYQPHPVEFA